MQDRAALSRKGAIDLPRPAGRAPPGIAKPPISEDPYSFTSIAMFDALKTFERPIIEVHISNIHARDELHRHSKLLAVVKDVICGLGP